MQTGKIDQFKSFSQFTSLKDFNNHIEHWMIDIKNQFTKKELIILKRLIRYSAKVYGVSNISINKLLSAVQRYDKIKVSEATFQRMKRKAIKLGLLNVHSTVRTDMSQSSNVWVFNSYVSKTINDTPCEVIEVSKSVSEQQSNKDEKTPHKSSNNYKTTKIIKERKSNKKENFDKEYISSSIPKKFTETVGTFFNAPDIYKLWDRLNLALRKTRQSEGVLIELDDYIKVFKEAIYKLKMGKIRGSFTGYIYSAWYKTATIEAMREKAKGENGGLYFNWLDE